jgi:hypothetical protein
MRSKIQNRGNPQLPEAAQNPDREDDLSVYFDKRAEDNEGIISSSKPKNIGESIKIFLQSTRDKISNWFQSAKDFIRSKLPGYQNSRALMNIRQYSAPLGENSEKKSTTISESSTEVTKDFPEYSDTQDTNDEQIKPENTINNQKNLESFKQFKKIYEKFKNGQLNSLDNFRTEDAKHYAEELLKKSEENIKNDPHYFFKNISEYKDVVVACAILDIPNKFALTPPQEDHERNFRLWVSAMGPEAVAKLPATESSLSVDLQQAKIYADWVVFQGLIGELPESVDQSIILLATNLRNMMESAKLAPAIDSLQHDVDGIAGDLMAFFEQATSDEVNLLSSSANDQRPVTSVKSASVPELTPKLLVASDPPPPPPPRRLKAAGDATATNADVLTDIPRSDPPPSPPPRVRKSSEEIQQKSKDAVMTLRSVAAPEVEPNNLSLSDCVDVLKNLRRSDPDDLQKLLAPDMESSEFHSLVNQSSLFFTDVINRRRIDPARQDDVFKLSGLWDSAKKNPRASAALSQLRFFKELDYLMSLFKRSN